MKRTLTLFAAILLLAVGAAAQKLSYQAVVRNSANELVYDATVSVSLKILAADGVTVQYAETQTTTTNQNGLLTLIIGEHPTGTYSLANVNWTDASIRTDITLPSGDVVTNTMPVTAVPYALYADGAGGNLDQVQSNWTETNTASKAYIQNKPAIPTVPTNVSAFQNDAQYVTQTQLDNAGYLTGYTETDPQFNAWDKDYNDLTNKPTIPTVPTNVSAFQNDAGYLTSYTETDPQFNAWDKDYNDLTNKPNIPVVNNATLTLKQGNTTLGTFTANASTDQEIEIPTQAIPDQVKSDWNATTGPAEILNKPTIPTVPTNVSAFQNDANYITINQVPAQVQSDWSETNTASTAYIQNKPVLFSGNYSDLTGAPTSVSAFQNDANYITINQVPAQVQSDWAETNTASTAYIQNKPAIPTTVSQLTNDVHYITVNEVPVQVQSDWAETNTASTAYIQNKPTIPVVNNATLTLKQGGATLGTFTANASTDQEIVIPTQAIPDQVNADWNATTGPAQILNKPTIPTVPTNVSAFQNDAHYVTQTQLDNAGYITGYTETDPQFNAWDKDYNDLTNKPTIPTVPTNVSAFQNDAGYLTSYTETDPQFNAWDKDYNDLTNKPAIPTVPTSVSAFQNDAGYLTSYTETDPQFNAWNKDYNDLTNKPTIPTVPTNVSAFQNDAGYLTSYTETDPQFNAWDKDYNDLTNKPTIPTVPTNVSAFQNDAGYLTSYTETQSLADVTAKGNSAGNRQLKNVSDPTDAQDAVTKSYLAAQTDAITASIQQQFDNLASQYQQQLGALSNSFQHTLDSLGAVIGAQQATINAQQHQLDSLINSGSTPTPPTPAAPTATTGTATDVTENSATLTGSVSNPDNVDITAQGFEWKATEGGTYAAVNATGETMTYSLTGLTASTGYTYRAFVTTANGTSYGEEVTFTTLSAGGTAVIDEKSCPEAQTVTDHEGNVYATVQIGDQCWMRDNLRTTTSPSTGTYLIPAADANYTYTGKQARWYGNDSATCVTNNYGLIYNWNAAVDTFNTAYGETSVNTSSSNAVSVTFTGHRRGICPAGWHLPSDAEWTAMTNYVGSQSAYTCGGNNIYIAKALASETGWNSSTDNCAVGNTLTANNVTGFSAVPAGQCSGSSFYGAGDGAYFWSSAHLESNYAYDRGLDYGNARVGRYGDGKNYGRSVRCLRDESGNTAQAPTVTTGTATNITENSATLSGSVTNPDNVTVTAQGFEWKATEGGTYAQVNVTGETMTYSLTGLAANTSYTYRAFVTTASGTSYGEEVTFTTLSAGGTAVIDDKSCPEAPTVTDHEGNVYATVQIGNQCWMRDNLRTTTSPSTGTYLIPAAGTGETYTGKQARWYGNDSATCVTNNYGLLYNWNAAVDTFNTAYGETSVNTSSSNAVSVTFTGHRRGICPAGWHLPSDAEWTAMTGYVSNQSEYQCGGNSSYIAKALASTEGWNSYSGECYPGDQSVTANNATGFSAVPAGHCGGSSFYFAGTYANFWSATRGENGPHYAYYRNLISFDARVYGYDNGKYYGYSVRCLRDESGNTAQAPTVTTGTATNITENSATLSGSVTNLDNVTIASKGFEYKALGSTAYTQVAATGTDDSFSATVSNLAPSTEYSYRAFVTYDNNTVYGGEVTFTTLCGNVQLSIQATKTSICPGVESVTLTASGAETYTWSTNETGASITITAPGHYTVVGQDANGCEGFTDIYIYEEVCAPVPQVATLEPTHDPELYYHYLSGQIVSDNGSAVTECGFCISDGDQEPTYPNSAMSVQNWTRNTFNKVLHVSDFTEGVTYYVRAYARNSAGTGYGETVTIKWPKHPVVNLSDNDITNVTDNSAAATASVELRNCTGIVAAGFCWREIENNVYPTLEDSHTVEAGSTSDYSFSSAITGLTQGIEYIVRAYVTTDENLTVYSGSSYFTTKCGAPTFELSACGDDCVEVTYDLTNTGAMDGIGAYIQYKEAAASVNSWYVEYAFSSPYYISYFLPNTEYEIQVGSHCDFESTSWSESKYFTVPYGSSAPTPAVTSAIPCTITSGHPAQTAALGYTASGANHGLETVTSDDKINSVTDYDGNEYPVVQIGSQCWLAENMRCTHSPSTGTYLIPAADANYTYTGKQARWNNNDSATYAPMNYGLLYNWNAAVDTFNTAYGETSVNGNAVSVKFSGHRRGICPAGWHLPSDAEWNTMEATVSGSDWQTSYETGAGYRGSHAGKLAGGDNWTTVTTSGAPGDYGYTDRDVSGFSAVPAGYCDGSSFNDAGNRAYFWSSFQHASNSTLAWYRDLSYSLAGVSRYYDIKRYGYSVRCLRD